MSLKKALFFLSLGSSALGRRSRAVFWEIGTFAQIFPQKWVDLCAIFYPEILKKSLTNTATGSIIVSVKRTEKRNRQAKRLVKTKFQKTY